MLGNAAACWLLLASSVGRDHTFATLSALRDDEVGD